MDHFGVPCLLLVHSLRGIVMGIVSATQVKFIWPSSISTEKLPVVEATLRRLSDNIIKHKLGWAQTAGRYANYQPRFHLIMSPLPTYPAACLTYLHEEGHALSPRQLHKQVKGSVQDVYSPSLQRRLRG